MTRYTQEDTLSTYLDLGRNSAIIFIADRALYTSIYFFDILNTNITQSQVIGDS